MKRKEDLSFDANFLKIVKKLEKLDRTFLIKGVPDEYKEIWIPKNEIKLWSIPRTSAEIIKSFALNNKAKTILELGTSAGYSTLWLASAVYQNKGKIYTIELTKPKIELAKKYFKEARLDKHIKQIEGKISDILNKWSKKVDFVFLDADKQNYFKYIKQLEPHLKVGAIIIADNASDFGYLMEDYLNYVSESPKYISYLINIDNGLMVSIKL